MSRSWNDGKKPAKSKFKSQPTNDWNCPKKCLSTPIINSQKVSLISASCFILQVDYLINEWVQKLAAVKDLTLGAAERTACSKYIVRNCFLTGISNFKMRWSNWWPGEKQCCYSSNKVRMKPKKDGLWMYCVQYMYHGQ